MFSSRCFSRIVCVATASCLSAFVLLFPVPGQSVEQESFVEPSQRVEREEGKTQSFRSRPDICAVHSDIF